MSQFETRIRDLQGRLSSSNADAALVAPGPNAYYLSGFAGEDDRHLLLVIPPTGDPTFVSPESYAGQVRNETRVGSVRPVPDNTAASVVEGLSELLPASDGRNYVDDRMRVETGHRVDRAFPDATVELLSELVGPMRRTKDPGELDALRRAAALTDEVSVAIRELGADAVGMTERDLANEIRSRLAERGATGVAFPPVVAAGPNGTRPTQYRHGERRIESGDPVVLDFGGFFDHYASDQTRTVVFEGDPPDGFVEAHAVVCEALEAGVEAAVPGATGHDVDAAARSVIEAAGYGDQFTTGTGHGVGLRGHEPPSIAPGSDDELRVGEALTVEPGIYVEGEFGVRLETVVALTDDGPEALNASPYGWQPL